MDKEKRKALVEEYKQRKTAGGVYKVTNRETGSYYMKGDINLEAAKNRFDFSKKTNSCVFFNLAKEWEQYGAEAFAFEILEEIEQKGEESLPAFKDRLKKLEESWRQRIETERSSSLVKGDRL